MKLPPQFQITLTGNTIDIIKRNNADQGVQFAYLMKRLLSGNEVADDAFEPFGLSVEVVPSSTER